MAYGVQTERMFRIAYLIPQSVMNRSRMGARVTDPVVRPTAGAQNIAQLGFGVGPNSDVFAHIPT
jgi:hypothetical protein